MAPEDAGILLGTLTIDFYEHAAGLCWDGLADAEAGVDAARRFLNDMRVEGLPPAAAQ